MKRERLIITSREIYGYYFKGIGQSGGCSNRKLLERKTGVDYNKLRNLFGDKRGFYYEDESVIIIRVMVNNFEKGRQSLIRRGPGGMEKFLKYTRGGSSY